MLTRIIYPDSSGKTRFRIKTQMYTLFLVLLSAQVSFAQMYQSYGSDNMLSFVYEDFEGPTFPPPGWALEYSGTLYWQHSTQASGYGIGTSSAVFNNYWSYPGTTQSLVLTALGPTISGDSLSFDHAYATYTVEVDRLAIETSSDGGTTYSTLITLYGGVSGQLVTAPPTEFYFIPTPSQWATKKYALPIGTNRIRFKAISAYGNNLYIDNCSIGSQLSVDVGVQSIDIANTTFSLPQIPKASVKNHGNTTQSFSVTMQITPGGYTSTKAATSLAPNTVLQLSFDEWNPSIGDYNFIVFTSLPGDMDNSNDTVQITIGVVQPQITNIEAFFRDGQTFVTWNNLQATNVRYTLYKSSTPIQYGYQLASAQKLGYVPDNSALNQRLTEIFGTATYLKIDSASAPLSSDRGLMAATSTESGLYYYAVTPSSDDLEDTTIVTGGNSLSTPVNESVMMPKPVWQQNETVSGKLFEIYVIYATKITSSIFPQMTNAVTLPYSFTIYKSGNVAPHPLTIHMPFSDILPPTTYFKMLGVPNEWVINIDFWLPGFPPMTYNYGFHEDHDVFSQFHSVPTSGILYNYITKEVEFIIDWALHNLPVDTTRVYMTGFSAGGISTLFNSIMISEKIAASLIYAPVIDLASRMGGALDVIWGTYQTNLLTNEGFTRNQRLNAMYLVGFNNLKSLPLLYTFCGKNDEAVGWEEKPAFYDSLRISKHGGYHFWGSTDHWNTYALSPWRLQFPNFSFFTRYRTNLSYPAFSNCSMDNDPGDGSPSSGDALGSINGHLDWNDDIVDEAGRWEVTLFVKDLLTTSGTLAAPDSATTDVTLRRLQIFEIPIDSTFLWKNIRNGIVVQEGTTTNTDGLITLHGVKVYKDSSRVIVYGSPVICVTNAGINKTYARVNVDSVLFTCKFLFLNKRLYNIYNEPFTAHLIYANTANTLIDSVALFDDGLHGDSLANDGIYGNYIPPVPIEDFFKLSVSTFDHHTNKYFSTPVDCKFTTAGPVVLDSVSCVKLSVPPMVYAVKTFVKNLSDTATIRNVKLKLICEDPWIQPIQSSVKDLPNIPPGGQVGPSTSFTVRYIDSLFPGYFNFKVEVLSDNWHYWTDSMQVVVTGVEDESQIPLTFNLEQNYPNPFNPNTVIGYRLPVISKVTLTVYDVLGKEVAVLVNEEQPAGKYEVEFDASRLASGIYFYKLQAGEYVAVKKMLLIK